MIYCLSQISTPSQKKIKILTWFQGIEDLVTISASIFIFYHKKNSIYACKITICNWKIGFTTVKLRYTIVNLRFTDVIGFLLACIVVTSSMNEWQNNYFSFQCFFLNSRFQNGNINFFYNQDFYFCFAFLTFIFSLMNVRLG